jgi:hypothetical protein
MAAEFPFAAFEFFLLAAGYPVDCCGGYVERVYNLVVEHARTSAGNRANSKLLLTGSAKLSDYEDVEEGSEFTGHFIRDGNASARQTKNYDIVPMGVIAKSRRKRPPRFLSVLK